LHRYRSERAVLQLCAPSQWLARLWDYGENGTIGDGTTADATAPMPVLHLSDAQTLSVSGYDACVLGSDRTIETCPVGSW
jgi:hypothetical protein